MVAYKKHLAFRLSLSYARWMHQLFRTRGWQLWSEIRDSNGSSTRIILGQLPSDIWAMKDKSGQLGELGSCSFEKFLRAEGICGVLSIVEPFEWEYAGVDAALKSTNVRHLLHPEADFGGIDPERLHKAVCFMEEVLQSSPIAKIYVHCKAGRGRSAAAVLAYLATKHPGLRPVPSDLASAHFLVRSARPQVKMGERKVKDLHRYYSRHGFGAIGLDEGTLLEATRLHKCARESLWRQRQSEVQWNEPLARYLSLMYGSCDSLALAD